MADRPDNELVAVFTAQDETTANIVVGLLESEGIQAMVQTAASVWQGHNAVVEAAVRQLAGNWGVVLVAEANADRSRELIAAYEPEEPEEKEKPLAWTTSYSSFSLRSPFMVCGAFAFVAAYAAWIGETIGEFVSLFFCGLMSLAWGILIRRQQRHVPEQFQAANLQVGSGLAIAGLAQLVLFAGRAGLFPVPRAIALAVYLLIVVGCICGVIRRAPAQMEVKHND